MVVWIGMASIYSWVWMLGSEDVVLLGDATFWSRCDVVGGICHWGGGLWGSL